jgi:hypothetical protein
MMMGAALRFFCEATAARPPPNSAGAKHAIATITVSQQIRRAAEFDPFILVTSDVLPKPFSKKRMPLISLIVPRWIDGKASAHGDFAKSPAFLSRQNRCIISVRYGQCAREIACPDDKGAGQDSCCGILLL